MANPDENSGQKKHSSTLHCPRCDSTRIYNPTCGYTGTYYHCKDCGYEGALVIEHEKREHESEDQDFSGKIPDDNTFPQGIPGESRSLTAGYIVLLILVALFLLIIIPGIAGVF